MKKTSGKWKTMKPWEKLLLIFGCIIAVLVIWIVIGVAVQISENGEYYKMHYSEKKERHIVYRTAEPEEYEEDIFADLTYMEKDRDIRYISGAQSTKIALDEDAAAYGANLSFFQQYFQCVINGDFDSYRDFFWDSYFDKENKEINYPYPEQPFTKQKIYQISVDYRRAEEVILSASESRNYYVVKYLIQDNNGTFRPELDENTSVALLFELTTKGETTKISKLVTFVD